MNVGVQWYGDLIPDEIFQCLAGEPADEFTDKVALILRVVSRRTARLPPGRLAGKLGGRLVPVVHIFGREWRFPPRHPGRVAQDVTNLDVLLAVRTELGPVPRDGCERVEQSSIDQDQRGQAGNGLGARPDIDDGALGPFLGLPSIGVSAPDVDDRLAVDVDTYRGP